MLRGPYIIVGPRAGGAAGGGLPIGRLSEAREAIRDTQDVIIFGGSRAVRRLVSARRNAHGRAYGHELDWTGRTE